MLKFNWKF